MKTEIIITPERTVTESDIVGFAGLSGDYHPAHTNDIYATTKSIAKKRVAHGLLILSISEGLFFRTNFFNWDNTPLLTLGFDNVKFPNPTYIGDTIHTELTIKSKRKSKSHPNMEIIVFNAKVLNQNNTVVCEYDHAIITGY
ncbi:MAG: MaoC/PaaZ C-terminal domain-containing protein [Thermoplasmatales archaeon]